MTTAILAFWLKTRAKNPSIFGGFLCFLRQKPFRPFHLFEANTGHFDGIRNSAKIIRTLHGIDLFGKFFRKFGKNREKYGKIRTNPTPIPTVDTFFIFSNNEGPFDPDTTHIHRKVLGNKIG